MTHNQIFFKTFIYIYNDTIFYSKKKWREKKN
jgi:hypothetical protein